MVRALTLRRAVSISATRNPTTEHGAGAQTRHTSDLGVAGSNPVRSALRWSVAQPGRAQDLQPRRLDLCSTPCTGTGAQDSRTSLNRVTRVRIPPGALNSPCGRAAYDTQELAVRLDLCPDQASAPGAKASRLLHLPWNKTGPPSLISGPPSVGRPVPVSSSGRSAQLRAGALLAVPSSPGCPQQLPGL